MDFEWDETKAKVNHAKHGVAFEAAPSVFRDVNRLDWADARMDYAEERRNVIGMANGIVLHVSYTMRDGVYRLISVRRANRKERQRYGNDPQVLF